MKEKNKKNINKKRRRSIMYILGGGILSEDWFLRNTKMIVLVVVLMFFYISNRYTCIIKIREIDHLQQELKDLKYSATEISAQLTSNTRPSQVEELVKRQGIGLERAKTPPYKLHK